MPYIFAVLQLANSPDVRKDSEKSGAFLRGRRCHRLRHVHGVTDKVVRAGVFVLPCSASATSLSGSPGKPRRHGIYIGKRRSPPHIVYAGKKRAMFSRYIYREIPGIYIGKNRTCFLLFEKEATRRVKTYRIYYSSRQRIVIQSPRRTLFFSPR